MTETPAVYQVEKKMIPDIEQFKNAIPVTEAVDRCPRCDNPDLGKMVLLRLEYCPCCNTWLRYAKHEEPRRQHPCK